MNQFPVMFWSCTAVWVVLAFYLFVLSRRAQRLGREREHRGKVVSEKQNRV